MLLAAFGAMQAAVLFPKTPSLLLRAEDVLHGLSLARLQVAAGKNRERPIHFPQVVELCRPRLAKSLEVARVDEIAHRDSIDGKILFLDRVANLVDIESILRAETPEIERRIHHHLGKLVRGNKADALAGLERALHEYPGKRQTILSVVVAAECLGAVGIVQKHHCPRAGSGFGCLDELRRRPPDRHEAIIKIYLE